MRLVAIYVPKTCLSHIFGKDHEGQTINLGGKYFYKFKESRRNVIIEERILNSKFIEPFWLNGITMVSAIVGENGSGKTSILNLFRNSDSNCRFVYESIDGEEFILIDSTDRDEVIYYSGIFNIYFPNNEFEHFWDLSKYRLMLDDLEYEELDIGSYLELHNSENLKRWIKFSKLRNTNNLFKDISLPKFEKIRIKINSFNIKHHDTPYEFRPFFNALKERIEKEREVREQDELEKYGLKTTEEIRNSRVVEKIRLELHILDSIIDKIQRIFESSGNKFLSKGEMVNRYNVESEEFISQPTSRDAFYWFLENAIISISGDKSDPKLPINEIRNLTEEMMLDLPESREIENWTEMDVNYEKALKIIKLYEEFILAFSSNFSFDRRVLISFAPEIQMSSGEKGLYDLFSGLNDFNFRFNHKIHTSYSGFNKRENTSNSKLLLLDEADLGFHPEWKKKYINIIQQVIPVIFEGSQIQIILTTHDPLTLSDIPNNNIVYLQKREGFTEVLDQSNPSRPSKTFGANISDLLADSFFVHSGLIGDFAKSKIKETIEWINENTNSKERESAWFNQELLYYKKIVSIIDERITRVKLSEMISELENSNEFNKLILDEEIEYLRKRRENLQ